MVEPVDESFVVDLHFLVERFRAAVDERSARTRLDVQNLVHIIGAGGKNHFSLHVLVVFRTTCSTLSSTSASDCKSPRTRFVPSHRNSSGLDFSAFSEKSCVMSDLGP